MARIVRFARLALSAVWMVLLTASGALAQGSLQIPLQFDFLNPGARSLAVGSAFAGLADDATAAFTNPAGLTILKIPEVSFEVRGRRLESPFLQGGRLSGPVTRIGIDTVAGPVYDDSVAASTGVSYLSFVLPRGNWSFAGYRHEFVRLDQGFEATGVFQGLGVRELALRARREVNITSYGAAGAYQLHRRVSLGAGIGVYQFELDAEFGRFFFEDLTGQEVPEFYSPPTFAPRTQRGQAEQRSDTTGIGFNVGGLFKLYEKSATPGATGPDFIKVGVVYRKSASFEFEAFEGSVNAPVPRNGTFRTPDAFAVGAAVQISEGATAGLELTWIGYESLADGFISAQAGATDPANFVINNGVEFHAGFEYYFVDVKGLPALRVGAWRDPDHAIRYELPANPTQTDERFAAYLPDRGDSIHYTFGAGVTISRLIDANVGADLSKRTRQISVSTVLRFWR